jgi:predicted NBD/HSP70 family sugar kinase
MSGRQFIGVSLVMPGIIDFETGTVIFSSQFRWSNVPLVEILKKSFPDMEIALDNDMNARALAESLYGELRNEQNAAILGIGSGVGAGLIINRRVYRGNSFTAGEVGHIPVDLNGKMCECGNYGCLQTYLADWAILDDARKYKQDADIGTILEAANDNEQWAASIIDRFVKSAINAVAYVSSLLNPDVIVLTGTMLEGYPMLRDRLLNDHTLQKRGNLRTSFRLTMSNLDRDCAVLGAGAYLYYKVYKEYI